MKCVVFVPGTMGSILTTPEGEEVWPPTPMEATFGYKRTSKLLQDDLVVGDVVRAVSCFDVYEPLIDTLDRMGYEEEGAAERLVLFPYDWRRDLEELADRLAERLDALPASTTEISIVAHSMGGLIGRLLLETGKYGGRPWFGKIRNFMTLGTPHLGAPLALARILALDSAMGISPQDFRAIASDRRYPSGYQLLPAPGEAACWDARAESMLGELDIYDPKVMNDLGLDPELVARAKWLHVTLGKGKAPANVRYFYFAGTGHKTVTRVNVTTKSRILTRSEDAGDGTVPLWSALPVSAQKQLVVGEHSSFFRENNFAAVFYRLYGKDFPQPPLGVDGGPTVRLSVQSLSIQKGTEIELLLIPSSPADKFEGKVVISRSEGPGKPFATVVSEHPVAYAGPPIPLLKLRLPGVGQPGFHSVDFVGEPASERPIQFIVTA